MRYSIFLLTSAIYGALATPTPDTTDNTLEKRDNSQGNFYLYGCGNCKCDAAYVYTDFTGATGCLNVGDQTAIGLTRQPTSLGGHATTCSLYFEENCQGNHQSAGVDGGKTWGCTAGDNRIKSVQCYFRD
jgi:hypothetical protein